MGDVRLIDLGPEVTQVVLATDGLGQIEFAYAESRPSLVYAPAGALAQALIHFELA